jgi:hypothetical protein
MLAILAVTHLGSGLIVALIVALVVAVIVALVLRAVGAPEPIPWLVGLLVFVLLLFA